MLVGEKQVMAYIVFARIAMAYIVVAYSVVCWLGPGEKQVFSSAKAEETKAWLEGMRRMKAGPQV